jgi:hypothetical protein
MDLDSLAGLRSSLSASRSQSSKRRKVPSHFEASLCENQIWSAPGKRYSIT